MSSPEFAAALAKSWVASLTNEHAARHERVGPGGDWILDQPEVIPAVWGDGDGVLWSEGEGLMLTGHQGVGKTTLAQQLVLRRIGLITEPLLGLPVQVSDRPVLYLAMDRPRQAARSMRRMVQESDRAFLNERLVRSEGPPPVDPLSSTQAFADFCEWACPNVGTVVVDSVKDLSAKLTDDGVASGLNSSWQELITRGVELLLLHHERKAGNGSKRTHALDDVYGSTWLTSGLGSVVTIDGLPGDALVSLHHVKQPADVVGPLHARHDHARGVTVLHDAARDPLTVLDAHPDGMDSYGLAEMVYGDSEGKTVKRMQRDLDRLVDAGLVTKTATKPGHGGKPRNVYRLADTVEWAAGLGGTGGR